MIGEIVGSVISAWSGNRQQKKALDYEKNRIQTTVADATAAGLHPLYALGSGVSGANPFSLGDPIGEATENIGRAYDQKQLEKQGRRLVDAQVKEAEARAKLASAEADEVTRALKASQRTRMTTEANSQQDILVLPQGTWKTGPSAQQQTIEEHYGGIIGEGYGLWRALTDAFGQGDTDKPKRKTNKRKRGRYK